MKQVAIIIFDDFTDIDLFLFWDILGRDKESWDIKILGTQSQHISRNGLSVSTHGHVSESHTADVVFFTSGIETRKLIKDTEFLKSFSLNPSKQLIGSICSGALILGALGFLENMKATTYPTAKTELQNMGIEVVDMPFVCQGNIATAGGCLAAQYLAGWIIQRIYGEDKKRKYLREIFPVGQYDIYEKLLNSSIEAGLLQNEEIH